MEGGKNQLGPNVGAVDIIHNQSVAGGDKSTSFTFRFSVCLLVPPTPVSTVSACVDQPGGRTGALGARRQGAIVLPSLQLRWKLALLRSRARGPLPQTFPQLIKFAAARELGQAGGDRQVRAGGEEGDGGDGDGEEAGGGGGVGAGRACGASSSGVCSDVLVPAQREMPPSLPL